MGFPSDSAPCPLIAAGDAALGDRHKHLAGLDECTGADWVRGMGGKPIRRHARLGTAATTTNFRENKKWRGP